MRRCNYGQCWLCDRFFGSQYLDGDADLVFGGSGAGWEVGNSGDVNGDGVDDIMFSCKYYGGQAYGQVYIYAGDTSWVVEVEKKAEPSIPEDYNLLSVYPNPFNSWVNIKFTSTFTGELKINIYNTLGQLVRKTIRGMLFIIRLFPRNGGRDQNGNNLPSGIYFVKA